MESSIQSLESFPPEVVIPILLELPLPDLARLCRASQYFSSFCRDWNFWSQRAVLDFNFPPKLFHHTSLLTPQERYLEVQEYWNNPDAFLKEAAQQGNAELVQYLIEAGAKDLNNALYFAVEANHGNVVQVLIAAGARDIHDAFARAAATGHLEAVKALLQVRPLQEADLHHALTEAARTGRSNIVRVLLQAGAGRGPSQSPDPRGGTALDDALFFAAGSGNLELVRELLDLGANRDRLKHALAFAASRGHLAIVQELINAGATGLNWALVKAAEAGQLNVVQELIKRGATDLNRALVVAAEYGRLNVVQELIKRGANNFDEALAATRLRKPKLVIQALQQARNPPASQSTWLSWLGNMFE
jgi:ankyrin repeat protein